METPESAIANITKHYPTGGKVLEHFKSLADFDNALSYHRNGLTSAEAAIRAAQSVGRDHLVQWLVVNMLVVLPLVLAQFGWSIWVAWGLINAALVGAYRKGLLPSQKTADTEKLFVKRAVDEYWLDRLTSLRPDMVALMAAVARTAAREQAERTREAANQREAAAKAEVAKKFAKEKAEREEKRAAAARAMLAKFEVAYDEWRFGIGMTQDLTDPAQVASTFAAAWDRHPLSKDPDAGLLRFFIDTDPRLRAFHRVLPTLPSQALY